MQKSKVGAESARSGIVICAVIVKTALEGVELARLQSNLRAAEHAVSQSAHGA